MSRLIRLTSTHKKHGAPDCCFVGSSLASDSGRLESGNASQAHRPPCARTPASPTLGCDRPFDFHVTASLLGTIATAFGRDRPLERPGDVICEGNRRIRAVQASSSWAHPFARSLSFTCQGLRVHHASFRCGQSGQSRKIPMHRGRGDGPTGRRCTAERVEKKSTAEAIEVSCRSADAI